MIKKKLVKQCLAGLLSFAMTVTLLPSGALGPVQAEENSVKPVLHYDMSHADGKLTDISGNHLDGTMSGITDADFTGAEGNNILNFDGSNKYVELPAGVIKNGGSYQNPSAGSEEAFTIEAVYTDNTQSTAWLFTLGTGTAVWNNDSTKNYLFVSPCAANQGAYTGKMLGAIAQGSELRYPESKILQGSTEGENIISVVFDQGNVTYYLNGDKTAVTESGFSIQDILKASNTDTCIGYIGKSLYSGDANFKGTLSDFKIYDQALTDDQVNSIHDEFAKENVVNVVKSKLLTTMLNGNASVEEVTSDLAFPAELDGVQLAWEPSDLTVFDATGKLLYSGEESKNVTIKVTGTYFGKEVFVESYTVSAVNKVNAEYEALTISNMDNIKGNITLPAAGKYGTPITWTSSNHEVINPQADGAKPAGVVTRQATDTKVTLTASIGGKEKKFEVTVKAAANVDKMTDYVFAYFIGNNPGEEEIYLATSQNGLDWEELNKGEPVLKSEMGTTGLRDPFILRSPEGDKFYLVATDLRICTDWDWGAAQTNGSQAIMVWESDDLVHWTDQRMVTISAQIEAGCTWAPEVFYDDTTGEYMVFWSSKVKTDNYSKQRQYYCKTRDFYTFTEPQLWIDESHSTIDSTVVRDDDGTYYRFAKNESETYIYLEKSDSLLGDWTIVNEKIASGVEGPCCFKFNDDDIENAGAKWCLLQDDFGGGGYYPMITDSLASGQFTRISANLPKKPRHGTVMNITAAEYEALMDAYAYPTLEDGSVPKYAAPGYTLPSEVEVLYKGEKSKVAVTWDKTANDFKEPGMVTATGTIASLGNKTVTAQIEVIAASEKLIYFIDSGVGSWNEKLKESGYYNAVKSEVELRNAIPDQLYEAGSWGFVNDKDYSVAGNRTSETDSIYTNGWWAKGGKNCEYIIPLEQGSYTATGYFGEWWDVTRPMKFYVEYKDDNNNVIKSDEVEVEINKSNKNKSISVDFQVDNVANTTEVHFLAVKAGSSDPVIAGLAVEKKSGEPDKVVTGVTLDQKSLTMEVGSTATLKATITPADATDKTLTWSSSNQDAVSVQNGVLTAKKPGTAIITVTTANGKTAICTVTVAEQIAVTGVTLNKNQVVLAPGENETLIATIEPSNAVNKYISWASSNTKVAEVQDGKITAKAEGKAVIVAMSANGKAAICQVMVLEGGLVEASSVTLNQTSMTLAPGESGTLVAEVAPANTTDPAVTWKSSNEKVAVVEDGEVTAKAVGTANITVTTVNGKTAKCKVTVKISAEKLTLNMSKAVIGVGEKITLKATVTPKNTTNSVSWSVDDKKVATVSSKGVVTAKKAGKAVVTAKIDGLTKKCTITVKKAPKSITLNAKTKTLKKGKKFQIKVTLPKNTASNQITYKSNDTKIATVSSSGKVTAKKKGTATITVTTFNKKKAKLKITVK